MTEELPILSEVNEQEPVKIIAEAVKSIRKARHMKTSQVAAAMGLAIRTYEHFEAGKGKITYARISQFAQETDSDPVAILISILLKSSNFALRCMDNKFATVAIATLHDLNEELGADLTTINTSNAIAAFDKLAKDISGHMRRQDPFTNSWMRERASRIAGAEFFRERPETSRRED